MLWEWGRLGRLRSPAIAVAGGSLFVLLELICGASMLLRGGHALGSVIGFGKWVDSEEWGILWEWGWSWEAGMF